MADTMKDYTEDTARLRTIIERLGDVQEEIQKLHEKYNRESLDMEMVNLIGRIAMNIARRTANMD